MQNVEDKLVKGLFTGRRVSLTEAERDVIANDVIDLLKAIGQLHVSRRRISVERLHQLQPPAKYYVTKIPTNYTDICRYILNVP